MIFDKLIKKIIPKRALNTSCIKRNRTGQRKFREKLVEIYGKCPLDNVNHKLCEAAHILPYAKCKNKKEKYDINNGILLSCNMHKAFDLNLFTFDEKTCKVKILKKNILKIEETEEIILSDYGLDGLEHKYIAKLDNKETKEFIKRRNKIIS